MSAIQDIPSANGFACEDWMDSISADLSTMLDRLLDTASDNLRVAKILVRMGLDPNNITYDALFNRLFEIVLANITLANMFALVGAVFFVATLLMRTMVPLRVANIGGCTFYATSGALSGNVTTFLLYLLSLPINAIRLRQMLKLVKKARSATQGDYFQNPQFGYYFLVLTSQRLLENIARLEGIIAQQKAGPRTAAASYVA